MGKKAPNADMPANVKQDANVIPRKRPESKQLVSGGVAVSIPLTKGALFVEIAPTATDPVFLDWDDTASSSEFDQVATLGLTRHFPIPHVDRPTSVSVISVSDFYVITI